MGNKSKSISWKRWVFRWTFRVCAAVVLILALVLLWFFRGPLYNRFVRFPKQAEAWAAIRAQRQDVTLDDAWTEYRGCLHMHSELSHDSEVPFPEILAAAKTADLDFLFLSDHCNDGKGDYSLQWRGDHDGVTFSPGFEMTAGFMPWGLPSDTVLDNATEPLKLAATIEQLDGILFFAHTEEERLWDLPQLTGMEIYNLHTDVKDEDLGQLMPHILLCIDAYPDQTFRLLFDRQTAILKRWDELNQDRRIVGIAANDAHQNQGFRGYYTEDGTFLLRERGPYDIGEYELNFLTRGLLRLALGPLEPGRELFCFTMDRYELSLRFVNTHVLARNKTELELVDALRQGRVFIAFDMIADARGFTYLAQAETRTAVMGETVALHQGGLTLKAESPLPCRFVLVRNGQQVAVEEGRTFEYAPNEAGVYRIEAELDILGEWTPWVYTNPIFVIATAPA